MEFSNLPEGSVPDAVLDEATLEIAHYMVLFSTEGRPSGSGILVKIGSASGIVTAAHVVDDLMNAASETIEVVISTDLHRLSMEKKFLTVYRHGPGHDASAGPDLGFFGINDTAKLGTLRSKKSFYTLPQGTTTVFAGVPDRRTPLCFLAGGPAEMATETGAKRTPQHVLKGTLFFGRVQITDERAADDYDLLDCATFAGVHGFPTDFGGVSGGGIWHLPITAQENRQGPPTFGYLKPELVGVAFYQTALRDNGREIRAHGPQSLELIAREVSGAG